jgi:hypothetical protein
LVAPQVGPQVGPQVAPQVAPPAAPPVAARVRPTGITLLAIFEIVVGLVGLLIVLEAAYWANYDFSNSNPGWGVIELALGTAYLLTSTAGFVVASRLWSLRPSAWSAAIVLCGALMSLDLLSAAIWGLTAADLFGVVVQLTLIWYLNREHVRELFLGVR